MKKFGLFLLKNNIHLMTFIFVLWVMWAAFNHTGLLLTQKLSLGAYALIVLHEYEEGYKQRFLKLMAGELAKLDVSVMDGRTHISQAVFITVTFSLALLFPTQMWLVLPLFVLGIFEGFVHTVGIAVFRLKKVSPGWYSAMLMFAYSIWALIVISRVVCFETVQWLWAALFFISAFVLMDLCFILSLGITPKRFISSLANLPKRVSNGSLTSSIV